jgi:hypothetical protein
LNSLHRSLIFKTLFSNPSFSPIWKLVDWAYRNPSDLLIYDERGNLAVDPRTSKIKSSDGVRQGDPMAPVLYALTMQPIFKAAVHASAEAKTHPAYATAILDDFKPVVNNVAAGGKLLDRFFGLIM